MLYNTYEDLKQPCWEDFRKDYCQSYNINLFDLTDEDYEIIDKEYDNAVNDILLYSIAVAEKIFDEDKINK